MVVLLVAALVGNASTAADRWFLSGVAALNALLGAVSLAHRQGRTTSDPATRTSADLGA